MIDDTRTVGVAQLAEHWTVAPDAEGSSPFAHPTLKMPHGARPWGFLYAQHEPRLGGASPLGTWSRGPKRTATAQGRPSVGRKRGAKPRADEQEPDTRRRRAGRAGKRPRSSRDQGDGDVDPAVVRRRPGSYLGRSRLTPERATPSRSRSEKSAEAVVAAPKPARAATPGRAGSCGERRAEREEERNDRESRRRQAPEAQATGARAGGQG